MHVCAVPLRPSCDITKFPEFLQLRRQTPLAPYEFVCHCPWVVLRIRLANLHPRPVRVFDELLVRLTSNPPNLAFLAAMHVVNQPIIGERTGIVCLEYESPTFVKVDRKRSEAIKGYVPLKCGHYSTPTSNGRTRHCRPSSINPLSLHRLRRIGSVELGIHLRHNRRARSQHRSSHVQAELPTELSRSIFAVRDYDREREPRFWQYRSFRFKLLHHRRPPLLADAERSIDYSQFEPHGTSVNDGGLNSTLFGNNLVTTLAMRDQCTYYV